ncbi:hypothetical protein [Variovorax sp. PBS-H4]|uniref:hypothetical protein n=1 Tax=Variovorax sp. PBS-H4 TaxID=434008 RepID=UPI0013A53CF2|nr:hypothetical protein [Variovorax sp. PBS-H4]
MTSDTDDSSIISECLWAAADGPFFPDWEFSTLFGLSREEVRDLICVFLSLSALSALLSFIHQRANYTRHHADSSDHKS